MTTTFTPETTPDLQAVSLDIRRRRRKLKQRVATGGLPLGIVLMRPPPEAEGMRLEALLRTTPKVGRVRMNIICRRARVLPSELLCELSLEDRRRLILAIPQDLQWFGRREAKGARA